MSLFPVAKYLAVLCIGIFGARYRARKRHEKLGDLLGTALSAKKRFPWLPVFEFAAMSIFNLSFIIPSYERREYMLVAAFASSMFLSAAYMVVEYLKVKDRIFIYQWGVCVNGEDFGEAKIVDRDRDENGSVTIKIRGRKALTYLEKDFEAAGAFDR